MQKSYPPVYIVEQEDSLREEFKMTDLELVYEAENEISFELSHLRWHIPKSSFYWKFKKWELKSGSQLQNYRPPKNNHILNMQKEKCY